MSLIPIIGAAARRRTVDFDPRQISNLLWWLDSDPATMFDAASGGSPVAAGNPIRRWEDSSGLGNHMITGVGTYGGVEGPDRAAATVNGRDVAHFGTSVKNLSSLVDTHTSHTWTFGIVVNREGAGNRCPFGSRQGSTGRIFRQQDSAHSYHHVGHVALNATGVTTAGWKRYILKSTPEDLVLIADGATPATAANTGYSSGPNLLALGHDGRASEAFLGDVAEFVAYQRVTTPEEDAALNAYWIDKYDL